MKILVTGGAGYIGSHTAHQLVEADHQVTVLDNFYSGFKRAIPPSASLIEGDVSDTIVLERVFSERFDAVLHFAAHIEAPESVENPLKYYRNNVAGSLALLAAVQRHKIANFIFSSTAAVYGEPKTREPLPEASELNPINPYGKSKLMVERIIQDVSQASGLRYVILRYFNAAGARADLKTGQSTPRATGLFKAAAEALVGKRERLTVFGNDYPTQDGTCERDYIHVEDLASAHLDALNYLQRAGASDVFNVGYGEAYSVLQVLETFQRVAGKKIEIDTGPRRTGDPAMVFASNEKIRRVLGWKPRFQDLEVICKTALAWERHGATPSRD